MAAVTAQGAVLEQKKLKGPDKYKSALVSTLDSDLKRRKLKKVKKKKKGREKVTFSRLHGLMSRAFQVFDKSGCCSCHCSGLL